MELNLKLLTKLFYNNHKSLFLSDIPEHADSQQVRVYIGQSSKSPSSSSSQIHCKHQHLNPLEITFNTLKTITKQWKTKLLPLYNNLLHAYKYITFWQSLLLVRNFIKSASKLANTTVYSITIRDEELF